ncbi:MAG: hypothetical protein PHH17_01830 [Candidatus Pacebacteria bacterium]|nr:hypothetical protein [Candidatus Paceibacterota bacterium]MDD3729094.1 hypothetical protein [Candidatus Paceibacterota bacterium]MDD4201605.1 hypothetical protein [Candidatus Paceibacterota bacterium]MDD4897621.1 hypothetical protein [Candidatus Paceibacterota bacterium]MDD5445928.1 hypothetical protein [Candidatus Paceibacterota bacterium]
MKNSSLEKEKKRIILSIFLLFLLIAFLSFALLFARGKFEKKEYIPDNQEIKFTKKTENIPSNENFIKRIYEIAPEGIIINDFSISKSNFEDENFSFSIYGFSPDTETLFLFLNNLRKEERIKDIYIPPSSWINSESFSLFFKL